MASRATLLECPSRWSLKNPDGPVVVGSCSLGLPHTERLWGQARYEGRMDGHGL